MYCVNRCDFCGACQSATCHMAELAVFSQVTAVHRWLQMITNLCVASTATQVGTLGNWTPGFLLRTAFPNKLYEDMSETLVS